MDFFKADLDVLQQFVTTLHECRDQLDGALKAMASGSGARLGTDALNRAADDFQHTWQYGLGQIGSMVKETGDAVTAARDVYQQADSAVAGAMGGMRAG